MNTLTSDLMGRHVLDPALDAQALNADQARLIFDPSDRVDSLAEMVHEHMRMSLQMARTLSDLARANGLELDCERMVAGFADDVTATLRHCELNTPDGPVSGKRLATRLAVHLDTLGDMSVPRNHAAARKCLHDLFCEVPRAALFADTVTHHLRPRRARALEAAYAVWENRRAARDRRSRRAEA